MGWYFGDPRVLVERVYVVCALLIEPLDVRVRLSLNVTLATVLIDD